MYFKLYGSDFDPKLLDIGTNPTAIHHKSNPVPKYSSWIFSTGKKTDNVIDVYDMSTLIVKELENHIESILAAIKKYNLNAVLEVVLTISSDENLSTPAIGFDSNVISFLDKVGASIDIDTYIR